MILLIYEQIIYNYMTNFYLMENKKISDTILDSSLILATNCQKYNLKLVKCGDYTQVYFFQNKMIKRDKIKSDREIELELINIKNKVNIEYRQENSCDKLKVIEKRNALRSCFKCQRLAKANMKDWRTFITLTFQENIQDLKSANKKFKNFIDQVRRIKKDLKYLCVTEFQKRGAVHYHLLTNIDINDKSLIYQQEDNKKFYHIKYWNEGFNSIEIMTNDVKKIVGYISKYMTKNIDDRLFNKHRYFNSKNLIEPKIIYIDLDNLKDLDYYKKNIQDKDLIYSNLYENPYDKSQVSFLEYLKK